VLEAALYAGIAEAARDWLEPYLNTRSPGSLGAPLATVERIQIAVGEIELLLYTNSHLIDGVSRRIDLQRDSVILPPDPVTGLEAGLVKVAAVANAAKAVDIALTLVGNPGLSFHHPLQRHHRDVLCGRVHEPQADVILRAVGREALERRKPAQA
jgi:alkylation response protein AidB-like acyl-CoA dehydrogenase